MSEEHEKRLDENLNIDTSSEDYIDESVLASQRSEKSADGLFDDLIADVSETMDKEDIEYIKKAYAIAREAHEGQFRCSGEPYIIHPVQVAKILYGLGMDSESMIAALLHDVVEDTDMTFEQLAAEGFTEEILNASEDKPHFVLKDAGEIIGMI